MAIVSDQFDPSGMFSKAGRVSLEMFQIIQQKNEILFNKKKFFKPKLTSFGLYDLDSLKQGTNSIEDIKEKNQTTNDKELKKAVTTKLSLNKSKTPFKKEPFSKTVSRDQLSQIFTKEKLNDKRFGMYHPRYNLVFKKSPLYVYETKEELPKKKKNKEKEERFSISKGRKNISINTHSSKSPDTPTNYNVDFSTLPDLPLKPLKKIRNPIPLEKQLPRKEIFISALNEKRFEYLELPQISTKVTRPQNISLKYGGRTGHNSLFSSERSGLEYKPKYDLVFPKDDLMIPNFKKTVPRKFNTQVTYTLNESSLTYDEYNTEDYSPTGKKITGPIFEKMLSRDMSTNDSKISLKEGSKSRSEKNIKIKENLEKHEKFPSVLNSERRNL